MHVRQGYYGFQDYAVQHCLDHFERCTGLESHEYINQQAIESAREFLATYSLPVLPNVAGMSHQDIANFFSQLPKAKRERASALSIEALTLEIRSVIEQIRVEDLTPEDEALISNVYGKQITYKCPKLWCDYFSTGFDNNEDRHKHVDSHERPFRCPNEGCFAFQFGYSSKSKLQEHTIKYHSSVGEEVRFPKATRLRDNDTLVQAAGRNDLAAMLVFLESGAAIDGAASTESKQRPENRIPICHAAKHGHVEACKLLLEWGANLRDLARIGVDSPMYLAINRNHPDVVHCLLREAKVEIAAADLSGWIQRACSRAQPETVRLLLESSHFRSYGKGEWKLKVPDWIDSACKNSAVNPDNIAIVKYLLGKGFSNKILPESLSDIKNRGGDYMASLLQPMSDEEVRAKNAVLMDYQRKLMLLEQQNKKKLMMAREQLA